jgi:lysophospholipase L1-like esterase
MADHLPRVGVLNEGISGNRILHDDNGPNALARFPRDVLELAGVRDLIVFEGINDIAFPDGKTPSHRTQRVSPEEMTGALQQIIDRAHAHGIRVYGATITPYVGQSAATPRGEAEREAVNAWIRTPGHFDGVIDFDKVMRDPQHQDQIRPGYGFSDHLHPSPAGYLAMGLEAAKVMAAAASKSD